MHVLGVLFVVLAVASAPAQAVTVTRLDGSSLEGELKAWDSAHIVLSSGEGEARLGTNELISLRWPQSTDADSEAKAALLIVELLDGTVLPADELTVADSQLHIALPGQAGVGEQRLSVPVAQAAAIQLRALEAPLDSQWQEIREQDFAGDVLVVLKKNGQSLDYVEGVLGDVTAEKIEFKLEGDTAQVDRDKVAGFLYRRPAAHPRTDAPCVLAGLSGLRASAERVELAGGLLRIATRSGVEFDWPLADIHFADFSAGKLVYLSDIRQATVQWSPLVGLPDGADLLRQYGQPRRDHSAFGGPLTVWNHPTATSGLAAGTRSFAKGLALRSRTEMVFRLPAGYQHFLATAGIEPATRGTGSVQLVVFGDDRLLHEEEITGQPQPLDLKLDVSGVRRLKIVVDFGKNLDSGDWLNLCDARLVK